VHALKFMGVIDEEGILKEEFDNLKQDYQNIMKRLIQASYGELFCLIPPKIANQTRLVKLFGDLLKLQKIKQS
jgi:hypothetical protein